MNQTVRQDLSVAMLKEAFGAFPSGVTALGALVAGSPVGMAVSSFTSVSMEPPLVLVCMSVTSVTWAELRPAPCLGLSVLGSDHGPLCRQLSQPGDRFAGVSWEATADGAVFVHGSSVWLDCTLEREVAAGDHWIVLLRIKGINLTPDVAPLVFHESRFRNLAD